MSFKTIVLLLAAGQGFLLSLALMTPRKKQNLANVFLGLIMLVVSLIVLNSWGMQVKYHSQPNRFPFWVFESYLILPVAMWFFAQLNTSPSYRFKGIHLLAFVPAAAEILAEASTIIYARIYGDFFRLLDLKVWMVATEILPPVAMVVVLAIYGRNLLAYLRDSGVSLKGRPTRVTGLSGIFVVFSLLTLLWIAEVVLHLSVFKYTEWLLTGLLFALGYIGYFQADFFALPQLAKKRAETNIFSQFNDQEELQRLNETIADRALYTHPKLSIDELSGVLRRPSRYISYLINHYHGKNFNDYINAWRVSDVISKIKDPREKHKTLLALALESGFNSKSSFNHIFKSHTGSTPSELMKAK